MGYNKNLSRFGVAGMAAVLGFAGFAQGNENNFSQSLSNGVHSASAQFNVNDGTDKLTITLMNTSTSVTSNVPWLTALFFNIQGATVTAGGETATGDSQKHVASGGGAVTPFHPLWADDPAGASNDVTNQWDYSANLANLTGVFSGLAGANYGIGSAGLTGTGGIFNQAPNGDPVDGPPGGIVPTLGEVGDLTDYSAFPDNINKMFTIETVTFVLNLTDGFDAKDVTIDEIGFVWGTGAEDAVVLIPLPMALPMGLAGLAGVVVMRRRATREKQLV